MCSKCDDLHSWGDISDTAIHRYRCVCHLCDDTYTVAVMSNMVGDLSGIVVVLHESSMVIAYILDKMS